MTPIRKKVGKSGEGALTPETGASSLNLLVRGDSRVLPRLLEYEEAPD
jgi:hypothetical protein